MNHHYQTLLGHQYRQVSKMFSEAQVDRLIQLVHENENRLFPNSFNKPNRSTSQKTWITIAQVFNSEFPNDKKTPEQIRVKWKNMRQKARESGQLHLLSKPIFPRRQDIDNEDFNYGSSVSNHSADNASELNPSLANVLGGVFTNNRFNEDSFGVKTEREASVLSCSSEPNSEPTASHCNRQNTQMRCVSVEPIHSIASHGRKISMEPNIRIPLITQGPPIVLESNGTRNKRQNSTTDDLQPTWSNLLTKRRRTIVDEVDELKRDLLAEELQNAKKIGLVLDEALNFVKRLNQPNGISDKLNGLMNGH